MVIFFDKNDMTHLLAKVEKILHIGFRATLNVHKNLRWLWTPCTELISRSVSQPASQSLSQPASQPVSQSVSQSVSQLVNKARRQSNNEARTQASGQTSCFYKRSYFTEQIKTKMFDLIIVNNIPLLVLIPHRRAVAALAESVPWRSTRYVLVRAVHGNFSQLNTFSSPYWTSSLSWPS